MNQDFSKPEHHDRAAASRFLRLFAACVLVTVTLVAAVNLVAYRYMLNQNNQTIVQLLSGWGRIYKPILYDEINPAISVFGASWARDAFDPVETGRLLGQTLFNHAVSGGTAYETRRFADSSLDNPNLEAAIVNLNNFYGEESVAQFRYGFDESILNVDSEGVANRWVGLSRAYSLALGGWAVGANIELISAIRARDRGDSNSDYLESYQHADLTRRNMKQTRERIFPTPDQQREPLLQVEKPEPDPVQLQELGFLLDGFCDRGVDIYTYYTPTHARKQSCDLSAKRELTTLSLLRRKQASCNARISYFNFAYPNAVTLEGVLSPVTSSLYYRADGHPRPTVGLLMAARMLEREFPAGTPVMLEQDFGVDLLTHEDAEGWLLERAARCEGDWGEDGHSDYTAALLMD